MDKLAAKDFGELKVADNVASVAPENGSTEKTITVSGDGHKAYQDVNNSTINDSPKTFNIDKIDTARFE